MNLCQQVKTPEIPVTTNASQVPVAELNEEQRAQLPIEVRIGFCLLANEALLQQTAFSITDGDALSEILAKELELEPTNEEVLRYVKGGMERLRDEKYLDFHRLELPVISKNYKNEEVEVWELHLQPVLTPNFEHIIREPLSVSWETFPPKKD